MRTCPFLLSIDWKIRSNIIGIVLRCAVYTAIVHNYTRTHTNRVNSFSTRRLSSCTDEYAHTYSTFPLTEEAVIV